MARTLLLQRHMAPLGRCTHLVALIARFALATPVALLGGCATPATNPDAQLSGHDALLFPGGCWSTRVTGVEHFEDLRTRGGGTFASHSLFERRVWFDQRAFLNLCGLEVGSSRVDLFSGSLLVDSVSVEVARLDHLELSAVQNAYPDEYPPVPGPVGVLAGRRAVVYVTAHTADGRRFDSVFLDAFEAVIEPPVEVSLNYGIFFEPMSPVPGVFPVQLTGGTEEHWVELLVVDDVDIVSIELAELDRPAGGKAYSVTGVTAQGQHILGVDAQLTINGVPQESSLGRWLFEGSATTPGATIAAEWNGLRAQLD